MTRRPPRPLLLLALLALLATALAACGEKEEPAPGSQAGEPEPFRVMLDYFPNADHAGLYAAQATGDYREGRLAVTLQPPPDPSAPLKLLEAGRVDLAISYEPELLLARDKGADLVAVGALVQVPLTSLMAVGDSNVRDVSDLRGERVGTAGIPYQSAYLRTILARAGVPASSVTETNVGFNLVPAMLSGRVAATLGSFWNYEGVDLERRGRDPRIWRMEQLGVPNYNELVFVARRTDLDEAGASRVRRFLQAVARGHEALRRDPAVGVDALLAADRGLDRELQTAVVERTLPVFFPDDDAKPFGWMEPREWDLYADWLHEQGLTERGEDGTRAMTNEFLPGEGLDPATITQRG